ncbi:MAG: hypothetical protein JOY55_15310 [Mycobacterium sp.]|nr:hypothetical protein [Mycobacterium sp.]
MSKTPSTTPTRRPLALSRKGLQIIIERTFGESRRRVKVIGRLPGETTCLSLVWAVLDRASRGWRGVTQTPATIRQLQDLRHQLLEPPRQLRPRTTKTAKTVTPAA